MLLGNKQIDIRKLIGNVRHFLRIFNFLMLATCTTHLTLLAFITLQYKF